ncbi:MAG: nuclear transport factor 2 family protein [Flavobacteriaceae bacterium]|nr:nuclear transport factor 2 family protein [Flavobacteriaceae bacterium]
MAFSQTTDTDISKTIIALEKAALEKWNQGNPSGYLDIYAKDITYFDPFHEKRIDGFEKMQAYYETLRGTIHVDKYEMIAPVVQITGKIAVLTYNLKSYSGTVIYHWNCTEVYRQQSDKQWKIIHNHWSLVKPLG